jgi:hypothetical protein
LGFPYFYFCILLATTSLATTSTTLGLFMFSRTPVYPALKVCWGFLLKHLSCLGRL